MSDADEIRKQERKRFDAMHRRAQKAESEAASLRRQLDRFIACTVALNSTARRIWAMVSPYHLRKAHMGWFQKLFSSPAPAGEKLFREAQKLKCNSDYMFMATSGKHLSPALKAKVAAYCDRLYRIVR